MSPQEEYNEARSRDVASICHAREGQRLVSLDPITPFSPPHPTADDRDAPPEVRTWRLRSPRILRLPDEPDALTAPRVRAGRSTATIRQSG
ncbi:hypothetical protein GCM10017559_10670 [Streptosporangium longisporum]|uniref:Uncharacterized protein n=1 Tax=Streptosporangium longisporum TaxID=46187 RepID=A0ABN3XTA3_9ACTN